MTTEPPLPSSEILRRARRETGLTQVELAIRASVTQSVVSAYEAGHREPSLPTLTALVAAAGYRIDFVLSPQPHSLAMLSGPLGQRVRHHRKELISTAGNHGVTNLGIFGSVARGEERPDSDVDILADLPTGMGLFGFGRVRDTLEDILHAPVDLIPSVGVKPDVQANLSRDLVPL
jgi:predicted nucleotidyltransferase/DNA-binding XRE family transcriptional regulator